MQAIAINVDWKKWLRAAKPGRQPAYLGRKHIYILPTRFGVLYAILLLAMLFGSINYSLSLGFVLTFLLAGVGNMAMLHTWRNLVHLSIEAQAVAPVFAGEYAAFNILIKEHQHRDRYAIAAMFDLTKSDLAKSDVAKRDPSTDGVETKPVYADIAASGTSQLAIQLATHQRGWVQAPRIRLYTEYPMLLFHAWAYADLSGEHPFRCLVYPKPSPLDLPIPECEIPSTQGGASHQKGDDDFAGHRLYQLGDSPKRVDWKASSREQGLLTKQFHSESQSSVWLDWASTPHYHTEQRISQLTRWVIDAHAEQLRFGLRLPRLTIEPNTGDMHYHECLQALALFERA